MKLKPRHLWWLLIPVILAVSLIGIQAFFHTRQKDAIENIEGLGGRVLTTHGGPEWLRRLAGRGMGKLFDRATVVNLRKTKITDAELIQLKRLNGLERLNLSETNTADHGLAHLEGLTGLKALDLSGTKISGRGLERLQGLDELEYLYLGDTEIADGDLDSLYGFRNLRELDLAETDVTESGIEELKRRMPGVVVKL